MPFKLSAAQKSALEQNIQQRILLVQEEASIDAGDAVKNHLYDVRNYSIERMFNEGHKTKLGQDEFVDMVKPVYDYFVASLNNITIPLSVENLQIVKDMYQFITDSINIECSFISNVTIEENEDGSLTSLDDVPYDNIDSFRQNLARRLQKALYFKFKALINGDMLELDIPDGVYALDYTINIQFVLNDLWNILVDKKTWELIKQDDETVDQKIQDLVVKYKNLGDKSFSGKIDEIQNELSLIKSPTDFEKHESIRFEKFVKQVYGESSISRRGFVIKALMMPELVLNERKGFIENILECYQRLSQHPDGKEIADKLLADAIRYSSFISNKEIAQGIVNVYLKEDILEQCKNLLMISGKHFYPKDYLDALNTVKYMLAALPYDNREFVLDGLKKWGMGNTRFTEDFSHDFQKTYAMIALARFEDIDITAAEINDAKESLSLRMETYGDEIKSNKNELLHKALFNMPAELLNDSLPLIIEQLGNDGVLEQCKHWFKMREKNVKKQGLDLESVWDMVTLTIGALEDEDKKTVLKALKTWNVPENYKGIRSRLTKIKGKVTKGPPKMKRQTSAERLLEAIEIQMNEATSSVSETDSDSPKNSSTDMSPLVSSVMDELSGHSDFRADDSSHSSDSQQNVSDDPPLGQRHSKDVEEEYKGCLRGERGKKRNSSASSWSRAVQTSNNVNHSKVSEISLTKAELTELESLLKDNNIDKKTKRKAMTVSQETTTLLEKANALFKAGDKEVVTLYKKYGLTETPDSTEIGKNSFSSRGFGR